MVNESVPPKLSKLETLASNLYWSWNPEATELFESIDPDQIRGGAHTTGYGGFQPTDDGLIKDGRNRTTGFKVQVRELVSK